MNNSFKRDLGKKIKLLRKEKGLTQEELFFESNVSSSHIGMIETAKKNPTLDVLFKISRALGVSLSQLLDFDDIEKYPYIKNEIK